MPCLERVFLKRSDAHQPRSVSANALIATRLPKKDSRTLFLDACVYSRKHENVTN